MADFDVLGVDQLRVLGAKLKVADKSLRRDMTKRITLATKPIIAKQRAAAEERLPHKGGLNRLVAGSKIGTRTTLAGRNIGVTIVARNADNIRSIDKGTVRHKTFGKPPWRTQTVPAGWFTDPADEAKPELMAAVKEAVNHTLKELG